MEENLVIKKPELLIPASCLEVLKLAIKYGADAVYIGGEMYGLRAKAKNFSKEDMTEGIKYAHEKGKKVFVTANITAHDKDLEGVREYFKELKEIKPDAIIISDPGVFMLAKEIAPEIDIHISTQANNVNYADFNFWYGLGATRVVSARELSLDEIAEIRNHIPADKEIETFVHGAMCMAYSGRCLLSNYMTGRDANQGACTHPCRWKYHVVEENRPGEYMPIEENERGTYIFNSKDLCMIDYLADMQKAGADALKIEGRMKSLYYTALVTRAYRKRIDALSGRISPDEAEPFIRELYNTAHRAFGTGFYFSKDDANKTARGESKSPYLMVGTIGERVGENRYEFISLNKITADMPLEYIGPNICSIEDTGYRLLEPETGAVRSWVCHGHPCIIETTAPLCSGFIVRTKALRETSENLGF